MIYENIKERYDLALGRIRELPEISCFFATINEVLTHVEAGSLRELSKDKLVGWNQELYQEIQEEHYKKSLCNPEVAVQKYGKETGQMISFLYTELQEAIMAAYQGDRAKVLQIMELYLEYIYEREAHGGRVPEKSLKQIIYYYRNDYAEQAMEKWTEELLNPENNHYTKLIMESDLQDDRFLYCYGLHITKHEERMLHFLNTMSEDTLASMANTYTEGYRKGFELAGIDLSQKKTVNIRYHVGFEPMVRKAIEQFREMGLEPVIYARENRVMQGIETTPANRQYMYDHRYDDALYLNHAWVIKQTELMETALRERKALATEYAGPAVIEVFGEELFSPVVKQEALSYSDKQQKEFVALRRDKSLIMNQFIPGDQYSFTIISYPMPQIGEQFEQIFKETVKVNTLDVMEYQKIQECLIDALNQGKFVHVTGRNENHTDITVALHPLTDPKTQSIFENCLADVNIPVGEVFTSPRLKGTNGVLHVTKTYLNEMHFHDLEIVFEDGMIRSYSCKNFSNSEENKRYIHENLLHNRDTMPLGEFAIGTNTTAYQMGLDYGISDKLPVLIGEKTGPHFAIGDTCYSMSEDIIVRNPDGKEVIARENECSMLRKTEIEKAYFNCHTDITIPYYELGDIEVCCEDGRKIVIIKDGRFILPGTERLNDAIRTKNDKQDEKTKARKSTMCKVGILMGSDSDLPIMQKAANMLEKFGIEYEMTIISAHRMPDVFVDYATKAEERGIEVIIAGAGGAAHLPGMCAALFSLPVIGIPIHTKSLGGVDSLYSIVQMPSGIPVATVAIDGAANAAILAAKMLAISDESLRKKIKEYAVEMKQGVMDKAAKLDKLGYEAYINQM